MKPELMKELARDIIALGSIPFYFIVFIRAVIGKFEPFIIQIIIAAIMIFILAKIIANSNMHVARSIVLFAFVSLYYKNTTFTFFAFLLLAALLFSAKYLKFKTMQIFNGAIIGIVSSIVAYYLEPFVLEMISAVT